MPDINTAVTATRLHGYALVLLLLAGCGDSDEEISPGGGGDSSPETLPPSIDGITQNSVWKYWDLGREPTLGWKDASYSDSSWAQGPGPLGFGEPYIRTTTASGPVTTYFRGAFNLSQAGTYDVEFEVMRDDGVVVYVNGQEFFRRGMPSGSVSYGTLAFYHEAYNSYETIVVPGISLAEGTNVISAEVHQASVTSGELIFDLSLRLRTPSASGWVRLSTPAGVYPYALSFVDRDRGWAVGGGGAIIHTTNGGATWDIQLSGTTQNLSDVQFVDASRGWAVGDEGVFSTTNGGATWVRRPTGASSGFHSLSFVSATTGWVVGRNSNAYKTTDGGTTWTAQAAGVYGHGVKFVDAQTGWIVAGISVLTENGVYDGRDILIHTSDGGATWNEQFRTDNHNVRLGSVDFVNATTGWVSRTSGMVNRNYGILATTDGGAAWTGQSYSLEYGIYGLDFISPMTGWGVGDEGTIIHTEDGGATWITQMSTGRTDDTLGNVQFVDAFVGWATIQGGILKTTTGGR